MTNLLVALAAAVTLVACSEREDVAPTATAPTTAQPSPTSAPAAVATLALATATPLPQASPTPFPTRTPGSTAVTGLFDEPRRVSVTEIRQLGAPTRSPFSAWDGVSTVLYDTQTRTERNLGPGSFGYFSPDSQRMGWYVGVPSTEQEVRVLDLATGTTSSLGNGRELITQVIERPLPSTQPAERVLPDGTRIRQTFRSDYPYPRSQFVVADRNERVLLNFEAHQVAPGGPGELVVATPPANGTTNIFIVNISTGEAAYVSTATYVAPNWPLGANADYVIWTESFCGVGQAQGKTRLYDRAANKITQLDVGVWVTMTSGGLIAIGEFGARALYDPKTLASVISLPEGRDVTWSPDYRYASRGDVGGHGGLCG